ncbi:MAG TPA: hypothetical protein VGF07_01585 [Stellaceae bacterium]
MNKLAIAAAAAVLLGAATASAHRGMSLQGPQLSGVALHSLVFAQPTVTGVALRSGETIDLRHRAN